MASILKLGGSSSISSRTRMPRLRLTVVVVAVVVVVRQERAKRRAIADEDEMESMMMLVLMMNDEWDDDDAYDDADAAVVVVVVIVVCIVSRSRVVEYLVGSGSGSGRSTPEVGIWRRTGKFINSHDSLSVNSD